MRFSCIRLPQRKATSASTATLPSQTICPPGRTASPTGGNPTGTPAHSMTTSVPRPSVRERANRGQPRAHRHASRQASWREIGAPGWGRWQSPQPRRRARSPGSRRGRPPPQPITSAVGALGEIGDVRRGAEARHHRAAEQRGAIEGHLARHLHRTGGGHDAVFGEGTQIHKLVNRLGAVAQPRGAVEMGKADAALSRYCVQRIGWSILQ